MGKETIDTGAKDKPSAERRARDVVRQKIAHQRARARDKLKKAGKPIPPDLQLQRQGRRKKVAPAPEPTTITSGARKKRGPYKPRKEKAPAAAAAAPQLDHEAIAARLRSLNEPAPDDDDMPPAPAPAPELGPEEPTPAQRPIPAEDAPPMPEPEPLQPEVVAPQTSEDGDLFAGILSTLAVAGFIKFQHKLADRQKPPLELDQPHAGSVGWVQQGLQGIIVRAIGNRVVGDGTKVLCGCLGISLSMWANARVKAPTPAPDATSANTESESERSAAPDAGKVQPAGLVHHRNGAPASGPAAATGKFR